MGYTHYWRQYRSFDDREWSDIIKYAKRICMSKEGKAVLGTEKKQADRLLIDDLEIIFNGKAKFDQNHETFLLSKHPPKPTQWGKEIVKDGYSLQCCKTNRKPYDKFVTAILIIADNIAPGAIVITSDGDTGDWQDGLDMGHQYMIGLKKPKDIAPRTESKVYVH
jgi:hypothetical protein